MSPAILPIAVAQAESTRDCNLQASRSTMAPALLGIALLLMALRPDLSCGEQGDSQYRQILLQEINSYRQQKRLSPLQLDDYLSPLATQHSLSMAKHKTLSHGEFEQRFSQSGARFCVENVC